MKDYKRRDLHASHTQNGYLFIFATAVRDSRKASFHKAHVRKNYVVKKEKRKIKSKKYYFVDICRKNLIKLTSILVLWSNPGPDKCSSNHH